LEYYWEQLSLAGKIYVVGFIYYLKIRKSGRLIMAATSYMFFIFCEVIIMGYAFGWGASKLLVK
jgi:hypothetical protein